VERLEAHRAFFASLITAQAACPRTPFRGLCSHAARALSWSRAVEDFYQRRIHHTPTDDPAFLYQDVTVALSEASKINNGQPVLHAVGLSTLNPQDGETALHIGAGTGYYTAVLARLTAPGGKVLAYEIEPALADLATANLSDLEHVTVYSRSGAEGPLPACNLIYVNAGATSPLDIWLDALLPGGVFCFRSRPMGQVERRAQAECC